MNPSKTPRSSKTKSDAQRACEARRKKRRLYELQEQELKTWMEKGWWRAAAAKKALIFAQMAGHPGEWRRYWCEAVGWVNAQTGEESITGNDATEQGWRGYVGSTMPHVWDDKMVARAIVAQLAVRPQLKVTAEQVTAWLQKTPPKLTEVSPGVWRPVD